MPKTSPHSNASPPGHVSRRYPGPMYVTLTPFSTHHLYHDHVSIAFPSFPRCNRISGYTPRARPRALTGLRLPAVGSPITCFPVRTYGCRNLGVLVLFPVSSLLRIATVLHVSQQLSYLCYRPPTPFYTIFPRTLVFLSRTTYQFPRILRVGRQPVDLRRRWVELPCARKPSCPS